MAMVRSDDFVHHRQADACALDALGPRLLAAVELREDIRPLVSRYSHPLIVHADENLAVAAFHTDFNGRWYRRVLHGVVQQIANSSSEGFIVRVDLGRSAASELDAVPGRVRLAAKVVDHPAHQFRAIARLEVVATRAGLHAA